MNLMKLMAVGLLLSCFSALLTGCSDNDDSSSKVLLRPVATMEVVQNKAYLSWKTVEGATEYVIEVYKVTDKGEELYKTEIVRQSPTLSYINRNSTNRSPCYLYMIRGKIMSSFIYSLHFIIDFKICQQFFQTFSKIFLSTAFTPA